MGAAAAVAVAGAIVGTAADKKFNVPKAPKAPPPPTDTTIQDAALADAAAKKQKRAGASQPTILTSPLGSTNQTSTGKTLLGL